MARAQRAAAAAAAARDGVGAKRKRCVLRCVPCWPLPHACVRARSLSTESPESPRGTDGYSLPLVDCGCNLSSSIPSLSREGREGRAESKRERENGRGRERLFFWEGGGCE